MTEIKKVQSDIIDLEASLKHTDTGLEEKLAKAEKKLEKLQELWVMGLSSRKIGTYSIKKSNIDHEGITSIWME